MHHSEPCDQEGVNKLLVVNPGVKPSLIQKKLSRGYIICALLQMVYRCVRRNRRRNHCDLDKESIGRAQH